MIERHIPLATPALFANDQTVKVDVFEGMARRKWYPETLKRPMGFEDVNHSINRYVSYFVESGDFIRTVDHYLQAGKSSLEASKFSMRVHNFIGRGHDVPESYFYFDGFNNLTLFYGDPKESMGVTAGIIMFKEREEFYGMDTSGLRPDDIMINQLQSPTYGNTHLVGEKFKNFRWEHLLVETYLSWARDVGLDRLYLIPSEYSTWDRVRENRRCNGPRRYNSTARKTGFKRENKRKPFCYDILGPQTEMYENFVKGEI